MPRIAGNHQPWRDRLYKHEFTSEFRSWNGRLYQLETSNAPGAGDWTAAPEVEPLLGDGLGSNFRIPLPDVPIFYRYHTWFALP